MLYQYRYSQFIASTFEHNTAIMRLCACIQNSCAITAATSRVMTGALLNRSLYDQRVYYSHQRESSSAAQRERPREQTRAIAKLMLHSIRVLRL